MNDVIMGMSVMCRYSISIARCRKVCWTYSI
jgi:hypothetical protein